MLRQSREPAGRVFRRLSRQGGGGVSDDTSARGAGGGGVGSHKRGGRHTRRLESIYIHKFRYLPLGIYLHTYIPDAAAFGIYLQTYIPDVAAFESIYIHKFRM